MNRREALRAMFIVVSSTRADAARPSVSTLIGTGSPGYSEQRVNNPYGLVIGPDRRLYFCDLDNQRIRRLDLKTGRTVTVAGNGQKGYSGDGGPAAAASLNMPHEIQFDSAGNVYIAERDNHVVRKVDAKTGGISTVAGTGAPGFSGDGGPATRAQLRHPHSIAVDRGGRLLICDTGNHRVRRVDLRSGLIETYGGTGERQPTPDGAAVKGTPLNGPRTIAISREGDLYLALREGNAIYRIAPDSATIHHVAGTGEQGYSGDGGPARAATFAGSRMPAAAFMWPTRKTMWCAASSSRPASSRRCSAPAGGGTAPNRIRFDAGWRGRTECSWTPPAFSTWETAKPTAFAS
jgi:sugar lactone lactonase YvrE